MREKLAKVTAIYGMNNIGKSTAICGVAAQLGNKVSVLKYPIYSLEPTGPNINKYLRMGNPDGWTAERAQEEYAQNRRDFEGELMWMRKNFRYILLEDYKGTGIAWGVIFDVPLLRMEEINKDLYEPDLNILLDGERFTTGIESNHTHESRGDLWEKGRKIHQMLAKRYGWKNVEAKLGELEREVEEITSLVAGKEIQRRKIIS